MEFCRQSAGSVSWKKEKRYVRNYFNRGLDFDDCGCPANVASQPAMGLLSEWRAWLDIFDPDYPAAYGAALGRQTKDGYREQDPGRGYYRIKDPGSE